MYSKYVGCLNVRFLSTFKFILPFTTFTLHLSLLSIFKFDCSFLKHNVKVVQKFEHLYRYYVKAIFRAAKNSFNIEILG